MNLVRFIYFVFLVLICVSCSSLKEIRSVVVYKSEDLTISKVTENTYTHTTFLKTNTFGKVPCNGMIVVNNRQAVIFDTTVDDNSSEELINFFQKELDVVILSIVATHFHEDCVGGLNAFHQKNIKSYANNKTIEFLNTQSEYAIPQIGFEDFLELKVGNEKVIAEYFGEGHTKDNIIGYYPKEKAMFGGCLLKESGANKGYLGDANESAWTQTVKNIFNKYPKKSIKIVVPGHGRTGGNELLDYTANLFE